jgi:hypothetical protein
MVPPESRSRDEKGELHMATKYDYRLSETSAGNPAFAPVEPTGGFGAFSRGAGMGNGGRFGGASVRPLGARNGGRGLRSLPGERLASEQQAERLAGGSPYGDASVEEVLDRPVGASRPRAAQERAHRPMSLFAFGVSRKRLEQSVRELGLPVTVARELDEADAVVTLRNYYKRKPGALRDAEARGVPIYVLKTNTILQMENMLASLYDLEADPQEAALRETAEAIGLVQASGRPVELAPQNAYVRRLQHQLAERNNLMSRSRGSEPNRRVELVPDEGRAWR